MWPIHCPSRDEKKLFHIIFRNIKALFNHAREQQPSVIFIDEVDSLCAARNDNISNHDRKVLNEILKQMEGKKIFFSIGHINVA